MGLKLLIADDEDAIRNGICKYLQLHTDRFEQIYTAENGQKALDEIILHRPDIMVLDVRMPLKTGLEVMQEANKLGIKPITIILSAYDEFKYAQQALHFGARDYLLKPVGSRDILSLVNKFADEIEGKLKKQEVSEDVLGIPAVVLRAEEYIKEHYNEDISAQEAADYAGITAGYLSTLFSQHLQCGFNELLNTVRVEHARVYLEQNYLKTYEIAYKVGFRDEKYFSRVFKKITGIPPSEYRKTSQGKEV